MSFFLEMELVELVELVVLFVLFVFFVFFLVGLYIKKSGVDYVIIRTYSAGVFAGYLEQLKGKKAVLKKARRIWRWAGAASLSQLAVDGTNDPESCKFPCEVSQIILTEVIEVLSVTEKAKKSIKEVEIWKA